MYPDWPGSAADLVPLPHCDGPKLGPFVFQGPQEMDFLEHLGEGTHAHVFKVKILGQIYALKLFRFVHIEDCYGPEEHVDPDNLEEMSAFYNYSDPFSSECRAFGRLQEDGYEELAIRCFGYLLLGEDHERAMMDQFSPLKLDFNGDIYCQGREEVRSRFLGKSGRPPPIRGIVKEFGPSDEDLRTKDVRRILQDVIRLQQLGIIHIDVAHTQIISGKICDFSTAITVPHFVTTPELNPCLTPEWIAAMEFETFQFSINDYWEFDEMVRVWNDEQEDGKNQISVHAFPGGIGCRIKYDLRRTPARDRVYSLVDPRSYDWRTSAANPGNGTTGALDGRNLGRRTKGSSHGKPRGAISKTHRRLNTKPPRWSKARANTRNTKLPFEGAQEHVGEEACVRRGLRVVITAATRAISSDTT
ncbi:kinetochore Sim4 complex subunit FTA2-domain-containing protein [Xylariaceae sp. FL1651]|nr:kinetochore Sim4 complex subunit FTA2-domain-containing protein [Xylariaceae sp. FL1651]